MNVKVSQNELMLKNLEYKFIDFSILLQKLIQTIMTDFYYLEFLKLL